jgi:hypothetical protein
MYENFIVPLPRSARKLRPQTHGILLDKMSKSMGGLRMPISIAEGNRRPHDPMQAAKFVLEAGLLVKHQILILTHWKTLQEALWCHPLQEFCGQANCMYGYPLLTFNSTLSNFNRFTFYSHYYMQSRLDIHKAHRPAQEACWNIL